MEDDDWPQDDPDSSTPPVFPHLRAVLRVAHELGAQWISLDDIGVDVIASLPTFVH
jgi:hypothetical protein